MKIEIKDQINRKNVMTKIETNYDRNKIIDINFMKIYIDHMLSYKIISKQWKKISHTTNRKLKIFILISTCHFLTTHTVIIVKD